MHSDDIRIWEFPSSCRKVILKLEVVEGLELKPSQTLNVRSPSVDKVLYDGVGCRLCATEC